MSVKEFLQEAQLVAVIADRTAHDIRYSYRSLSGIAVASVKIIVITVSN